MERIRTKQGLPRTDCAWSSRKDVAHARSWGHATRPESFGYPVSGIRIWSAFPSPASVRVGKGSHDCRALKNIQRAPSRRVGGFGSRREPIAPRSNACFFTYRFLFLSWRTQTVLLSNHRKSTKDYLQHVLRARVFESDARFFRGGL